jgi:hypothetical protein
VGGPIRARHRPPHRCELISSGQRCPARAGRSIAPAPSTARCSGFVTDARVEGRDRIVTFFTGTVLRERIVDVDDDTRRLVWSIVDGPYTHHNASAQVFADGEVGTLFVWIADLLPDEAVGQTGDMMQRGITTIKQKLEQAGNEPHHR